MRKGRDLRTARRDGAGEVKLGELFFLVLDDWRGLWLTACHALVVPVAGSVSTHMYLACVVYSVSSWISSHVVYAQTICTSAQCITGPFRKNFGSPDARILDRETVGHVHSCSNFVAFQRQQRHHLASPLRTIRIVHARQVDRFIPVTFLPMTRDVR